MTQRDTFIDELFKIAKEDKDVILISVDMGASALDQWREESCQSNLFGLVFQNNIV